MGENTTYVPVVNALPESFVYRSWGGGAGRYFSRR